MVVAVITCLKPSTRGVHGSVRFGLDLKNQPNRVILVLRNINRIEPKSGSNRTGSVRLNSVFLGKKLRNLIPSPENLKIQQIMKLTKSTANLNFL